MFRSIPDEYQEGRQGHERPSTLIIKPAEEKPRDEIKPTDAYAYISGLRRTLFSLIASAGATRQLSEEASVYGIAVSETIYSALAAIILICELADHIFGSSPVVKESHSSARSTIYFSFRACAIILNVVGAALLVVGLSENEEAAHHSLPHNFTNVSDGNATLLPVTHCIAGQNLNPKSMAGVVSLVAGWGLTLSVDSQKARRLKVPGSLEHWQEVFEEPEEESNSIKILKF